jgi:hypothetical protein
VPSTATATVASGGFLTTAELRKNLRRSPQTIRLFVADGMPVHRVNRRLYFDPTEVEGWLRARNSRSGADDHRATIERLVDTAPELTAEQAERIRAVLTGGAA